MAAQYQLIMRTGPTPGKTFPLDGDVVVIGREATNGVSINDAEVSRRHSQLSFQGGKYIVTDLGSTNGTYVNGQRITGQHVLVPGDVISLGEQISFSFETLAQVDPNATMISSSANPPAAVPRASTPVPPPYRQAPQAGGYAGQVPSSGPEAAAPAPKSGSKRTGIIIAVVVVLLLCCCVAVPFIYDQMNLWCSPVTSWLVPMIGGVCP